MQAPIALTAFPPAPHSGRGRKSVFCEINIFLSPPAVETAGYKNVVPSGLSRLRLLTLSQGFCVHFSFFVQSRFEHPLPFAHRFCSPFLSILLKNRSFLKNF